MASVYPQGYKPRYRAGDRWVREEQADLPSGLKAGDLPAFLAEHGIPATAEFGTVEQYGDVTVVLTWLVDD